MKKINFKNLMLFLILFIITFLIFTISNFIMSYNKGNIEFIEAINNNIEATSKKNIEKNEDKKNIQSYKFSPNMKSSEINDESMKNLNKKLSEIEGFKSLSNYYKPENHNFNMYINKDLSNNIEFEELIDDMGMKIIRPKNFEKTVLGYNGNTTVFFIDENMIGDKYNLIEGKDFTKDDITKYYNSGEIPVIVSGKLFDNYKVGEVYPATYNISGYSSKNNATQEEIKQIIQQNNKYGSVYKFKIIGRANSPMLSLKSNIDAFKKINMLPNMYLELGNSTMPRNVIIMPPIYSNTGLPLFKYDNKMQINVKVDYSEDLRKRERMDKYVGNGTVEELNYIGNLEENRLYNYKFNFWTIAICLLVITAFIFNLFYYKLKLNNFKFHILTMYSIPLACFLIFYFLYSNICDLINSIFVTKQGQGIEMFLLEFDIKVIIINFGLICIAITLVNLIKFIIDQKIKKIKMLYD